MSGLPQGGFGERKQTGRRRVLVAGGMVLLLTIVWSYAVLSYGSDEEGAGENGSEGDRTAGQAEHASSPAEDEPEAIEARG